MTRAERTVVLGLGSNLGSRREWLRAARAMITPLAVGARGVRSSRVYESAAVGPPQPDYLNAAVALETDLSPEELLVRTQRIEAALGRVRTIRWGARSIDIDILGIEGVSVDTPELTVPHRALFTRPFAWAPLRDVLPEAGAWSFEGEVPAIATPRDAPLVSCAQHHDFTEFVVDAKHAMPGDDDAIASLLAAAAQWVAKEVFAAIPSSPSTAQTLDCLERVAPPGAEQITELLQWLGEAARDGREAVACPFLRTPDGAWHARLVTRLRAPMRGDPLELLVLEATPRRVRIRLA